MYLMLSKGKTLKAIISLFAITRSFKISYSFDGCRLLIKGTGRLVML